ncbi:MAG TPA: hypothetical protein VKE74_33635 [Gemmataceae bacterium]|nr:hypothetical protein [Gemmataceae bacterium]
MALARWHRPSAGEWVVAVLALATASCSSSGALNSVRGKVSVGGQPAAGAMLVFHREGATIKDMPPTATAESDGTFRVSTGGKPGAPAGKYTVTVVWPEAKKLTEKEVMMGANPNDGPDRLKGAYDSPQKSNIRVEIKSGDNTLEPFELK